MRCALVIALSLAACSSGSPAHISAIDLVRDPTIIYLVRHAEKETGGTSSDPALTKKGNERAESLSRLLSDVSIVAVFSTDYTRTRSTAEPVTRRRNLRTTIYDPTRLDEFADELRSMKPGSYLVVGHSNTTPELVDLLGGVPGPPIVEATEYDRLYVLYLDPSGKVTTQLLRF